MPDKTTYSGTNDQGNSYRNLENTSTGQTGYHYSNTDNSYYYKDTDNSTYYNTGNGFAQYTAPTGDKYNYYTKK